MAEKLAFTSPLVDTIPNRPGLTASVPEVVPYRLILELGIDRGDGSALPTYQDQGSMVILTVAGVKGFDLTVKLSSDAAARTKITALNKINLSTKSLLKRALEDLEQFLSQYDGTISGTPE